MSSKDELNGQLSTLSRRSGRTLIVIIAVQGILLVLAVVGISLLTGQAVTENARINKSIHASTVSLCAFMLDIGDAPVTPPGSPLGVKILVDSRNAFHGLDCPGRLQPPSPLLVKLASKYHYPLRW